ncbi:MAG: SanA/YdcF family protein [Patescibacteria group bacterium]
MSRVKNLSILLFAFFLLFITPWVILQLNYRMFYKSRTEPKVAIVFGAGLVSGAPSKVLQARLDESVALYDNKKILKILVSGDNREMDYNEPQAMKNYLLQKGIPDSDIVLDYAGLRTIDTCVRAKNTYQISSAYVISQPFHLPRALWLCSAQGLDVKTVGAKNLPIGGTIYQYFREIPSSFSAIFESLYYNNAIPSDGTETKLNNI